MIVQGMFMWELLFFWTPIQIETIQTNIDDIFVSFIDFLSSRDSYNHVSSWLNDAKALANPDIAIVLVGNKIDLTNEREVSFLEASRFAQENGKQAPA
jgi:GTPase SAR1 family protein